MDTVSRQEILVAYLCVIYTVALVLWWSRVSGRDGCGQSEPARAGQREPARAVSAQSAFTRTARDLWAPEARAVYVREPAFRRSPPALTGIGNGGRGSAPSSAVRDAYAASLIHSAPSLLEQAASSERRSPSSARMRANAREAPATPGAPALPPSSARWRLENMGVSGLEERCAENEREKDRRPREMTNVIGSDI